MFKHSRHLTPAALTWNGQIDRKKVKLTCSEEVVQDPAGFIDSIKGSHMWGHITLEAHFFKHSIVVSIFMRDLPDMPLLKAVPAEIRGVPHEILSALWVTEQALRLSLRKG